MKKSVGILAATVVFILARGAVYATPTPAAQAFIEPGQAVSGFPVYYSYRISADGTGDITEARIKIPEGAFGVSELSSGYPGASAVYSSGEVVVTYASPWNVFSNPNFDVIKFTAVSDPGDKYYGSYLNSLADAQGVTPNGFSQYVIITTSTPTLTITQTHSVTPTITVTFLDTFTITETHTRTPTITRTVSRTQTPDWTATHTPTITETPTGTPPTLTQTATSTGTATRTVTPTSTASPTGTPTFTATFTATFTVTPTATVTNTITIKGIDAAVDDYSRYTAAAGEPSAPLSVIKLRNIGGADEDISGIRITARGGGSNPVNMSDVFTGLYIVDASSNTIASAPAPLSDSYYFSFTPGFTVPLQAVEKLYVYADIKDVTFTASVAAGIDAAADVSAGVPVEAEGGYSFPMYPEPLNIKLRTEVLRVSYYDLAPPSVSTGQAGVYAFMIVFDNPGGADYSAALINSLTVTVKDVFDNPIAAGSAISKIEVRDSLKTYFSSTQTALSPSINCVLPEPVTVPADSQKSVYFVVDITGNTLTKARDFKLSVETPSEISLSEYHYGMPVTVYAASGFDFPQESSGSLIQIRASGVDVSHSDKMPAYISTGQQDVEAMRLSVVNEGNTSTASAMVTRINFYVNDIFDGYIEPSNVLKAIRVTSPDGQTVYGNSSVFSGNKINVNFNSPVVVSSGFPAELSVKFDAADVYYPGAFKISLNSHDDIYAVDANIFGQIDTGPAAGFPKRSGAALMQEAVPGVSLSGFTPYLPPGVLKGGAGIRVFSYEITNDSGALGASAECAGVTVTVRNSSGEQIAAGSAVSAVYILDGAGNTIGTGSAGTGSKIYIDFSPPYVIPSGETASFDSFLDVPPSAYAADFVVFVESGNDISARDINSGEEAPKTISPAIPWETGSADIYSSPASAMTAGGDGNIAPVFVGKGQPDVKFMIFDFYNPGTVGTADILVNGITVTALDETGTMIAPASAVSSAKIIDAGSLIVSGVADLSGMTTPQPFYIPSSLFVPYSTTVNAYIAVDVGIDAVAEHFMLRVDSVNSINANSYPSGELTLSAPPGMSYPVDSKIATISSYALSFGIGHRDLMPVSAVRGGAGIRAMDIIFENTNFSPINVTFTSFSIKDSSGASVPAGRAASMFYLLDESGAQVASAPAPDSGTVNLYPASYYVDADSTGYLTLAFDVSSSGEGVFYAEVENETKIRTLPVTIINPVVGEYFGGIKSSTVSIQKPDFSESAHAFPNPFNPNEGPARIEYYLDADSRVTIRIFTLTGRMVKEVIKDTLKASGIHSEDTWQAVNDSGRGVKSGVYIVMIEADNVLTGEKKKAVKRIVVLR